MILPILIGLSAATGIGFILADVFGVPSLRASKAANSLGRKGEKKTSAIELYLKDLSEKVSKIVRLNEFKRANLAVDLRTAGMDETPEQYIADAIVKAMLIGIFAIPAFFISKLIALLLLGGAALIYFSESKQVTRRIRKKRESIEYDLPRFVGHIERLVTHSRDIIYIVESFIPTAGQEFADELLITVAEMRSSGNIHGSLESLDKRIGSNWLSEVVHALEAVENSTDTTALWASMLMKYKELQRLQLKSEANAIPRKVKRLSLALLICFLMIYAAVLGQVLMSTLSQIG